ncbi:MAG: MBOAT family protein [Nitrospirota bacterium]|nr:MBOAT family protein [Nitrospirota bacterium]
MLFFSYEYIFAFLPLAVVGYFWLARRRLTVAAQAWLVFCSLFFYSWGRVEFLPVILVSILFNYAVGSSLKRGGDGGNGTRLLAFGILGNLAGLAWFKYTDWAIANINLATGTHIAAWHLALPLGISFFTFQQIAYLVDTRRGLARERHFLDYCLFVTFFPQLVSGPIVHHTEMMTQFARLRNMTVHWRNIAHGGVIFTIGLAKKVIIADTLAVWATSGFDKAPELNIVEGWVTSLCYSMQLYFDFSGYMDMALGAALLFNIRLPINFDSPYKAVSIQDFWRRWHMTLSRFLRDYLYVPLGGNRKGEPRALGNLMVVFLLGGLWHGAGWTFVFWGFLHGLASTVHRVWTRLGGRLPVVAAWLVTFLFVNFAWVFFRAKEWADATRVIKAMFGMGAPLGGLYPSGALAHLGPTPEVMQNLGKLVGLLMHRPGTTLTDLGVAAAPYVMLVLLLASTLACAVAPNSHAIAARFRPTLRGAWGWGLALGAIALYVVMDRNRVTEFIYFGF